MNILICTQTVDRQDPVLGFFHRWLEEFSLHCRHVQVLCLRAGDMALPANVSVRVLPSGKLSRAYAVCRYAWAFRAEYDAVLVHMNPEYLIAAGWLWRLLGKRTALWYTHKSVTLRLRIAVLFADSIFTASKNSFRLRSSKVRVMGHGIDTGFFSPDSGIQRGSHLLSAGRLMPSKRHDLAIRAAGQAGMALHVAGSGPEQAHLEALARQLGVQAVFLGGINQEQLRDEYRRAATLIHTSETGSLDKVVLEALACGLPVVTTSSALVGIPVVSALPTPKGIANACRQARPADIDYVRKHHSLQKLIPAIIGKWENGDILCRS